MTSGKSILRNEGDWEDWLAETFADIFGHEETDAREELRNSPDRPKSFPVAICWCARRSQYDWFSYFLVYPVDLQ